MKQVYGDEWFAGGRERVRAGERVSGEGGNETSPDAYAMSPAGVEDGAERRAAVSNSRVVPATARRPRLPIYTAMPYGHGETVDDHRLWVLTRQDDFNFIRAFWVGSRPALTQVSGSFAVNGPVAGERGRRAEPERGTLGNVVGEAC